MCICVYIIYNVCLYGLLVFRYRTTNVEYHFFVYTFFPTKKRIYKYVVSRCLCLLLLLLV